MHGILIPVDNSTPVETVVRAVAARTRDGAVEAVHLLNVQAPLSAYVTRFVAAGSVRAFQRERGERALADIRRRLDAAGLRYTAHQHVGDVAGTIGQVAGELGAREILLATARKDWLDSLMTWLWVGRIRRHASVPVVVVMAPPPVPAPALGRFRPT